MKQGYLGEFEELLLLAILLLAGNAYGVTIKKAIEKTGRATSYGAIYATLERLEGKGFISPRKGEVTAERGGRAKTYYKVEGAGLRALEQADATRRALAPAFGGALAGGIA